MTVNRIEAVFRCDGCNTEFSMDIDPADEPLEGWSMFDVAENALLGGHVGIIGPNGHPSLQGGYHLCPHCTDKVDAAFQTDEPTPDQVREVLAG